MGKEGKVFTVFILVVLFYGLSYYVTNNWRFAFSPAYSSYALGFVSLAFFFYKKMTKYSFLLIAMGFSCFYPLANMEGYTLIQPSNFIFVKTIAIIFTSLSISYDLNKGKYKSLKWLLIPFIGIIFLFFFIRIIGSVIELEIGFTNEFSFLKNLMCFSLIGLILRKQGVESILPVMLLRLLVVIGLSFFIEWMDFLTH